MNYYKVTVKRGHQGSGQYVPITFYFMAKSLWSAINKAKQMPGVKHHASIISAQQITKEEYKEMSTKSAYINDFDLSALEAMKESTKKLEDAPKYNFNNTRFEE